MEAVSDLLAQQESGDGEKAGHDPDDGYRRPDRSPQEGKRNPDGQGIDARGHRQQQHRTESERPVGRLFTATLPRRIRRFCRLVAGTL